MMRVELFFMMIILILTSSAGYADDWNREDAAMQILYSAYHIGDWNQTLQIPADNNYEEANIFLGRNPSEDQINGYFAGTLLMHWYIAKELRRPYRTYWQMIWLNIQYDTVRGNKRNGFKINFKF